ncbi:MAG TPA: GGDEF domain-containing protein [Burkholderiales bacterium]|nr:GGDEF domain-containing protein [Burkholderiales bacterium]
MLRASLPPALRPVMMPAAVLLAGALVAGTGPRLPPSLAGLKTLGPFFALSLAALISLWFNRGRAFIAAASLLGAYAGYRYALHLPHAAFSARAVYTALVVLVPFNVLLALIVPERGISYHHNYRWLLLAVVEALLVAWIAAAGRSAMLSGLAWHRVLDFWLLRSPPTPLAGRLMFAAAFVAAVARAWPERSPLDVGLAGALLAFFIGAEFVTPFGVFSTFLTAGGAILLLAVVQESHRLAYRDQLTGLPGRRALEERLTGLGPRYAIAMVDVDHFKQFNDRHGHDVGDQVLKLVAARLEAVEGGGRAFRYGGEEFCVVFPERTLEEARPHLEKLRASIETYQMAVRGPDRPKDEDAGSKRRAAGQADKTLSVTVSIGAAQPGKKAHTPHQVIKASDQALYRAKQGGRNRVSL